MARNNYDEGGYGDFEYDVYGPDAYGNTPPRFYTQPGAGDYPASGFEPVVTLPRRRWPAFVAGVVLTLGIPPAWETFVSPHFGTFAAATPTETTARKTAAVSPTSSAQSTKTKATAPSVTSTVTPTAPASASPNAQTCPVPAATPMKTAPGKGKTVALTIDDGPSPQTPKVLEILQREGVPATFFVTGEHAARYPAELGKIALAGHLVAGHSYDHRYPTEVSGGWTPAFLADQLSRTNSLITKATNNPVCFFRPPGGFMTNVIEAAQRVGQRTVMWSVDSEDWKQPAGTTTEATAAIVKAATNVKDQTNPIILIHEDKASHEPETKVSSNRSNTLAALPEIIRWYRAHGYTFVTLDGK